MKGTILLCDITNNFSLGQLFGPTSVKYGGSDNMRREREKEKEKTRSSILILEQTGFDFIYFILGLNWAHFIFPVGKVKKCDG